MTSYGYEGTEANRKDYEPTDDPNRERSKTMKLNSILSRSRTSPGRPPRCWR